MTRCEDFLWPIQCSETRGLPSFIWLLQDHGNTSKSSKNSRSQYKKWNEKKTVFRTVIYDRLQTGSTIFVSIVHGFSPYYFMITQQLPLIKTRSICHHVRNGALRGITKSRASELKLTLEGTLGLLLQRTAGLIQRGLLNWRKRVGSAFWTSSGLPRRKTQLQALPRAVVDPWDQDRWRWISIFRKLEAWNLNAETRLTLERRFQTYHFRLSRSIRCSWTWLCSS